MARIESSSNPSSSQGKKLPNLVKPLWWILRLPFRITFRFIIIVLVVFLFVEIIRTGLWHIPYASAILYRQPQPVREVKASAYSLDLLLLQVNELVTERITRPSLTLSEGQLTALLQTSLAKEKLQPFSSGQLAIQERDLQFFGNLKSNPRVYITANLVPQVKDSSLRMDITQLRVGGVRVPQYLVSSTILDAISSYALRAGLEKVKVESIELQIGKLLLESISL